MIVQAKTTQIKSMENCGKNIQNFMLLERYKETVNMSRIGTRFSSIIPKSGITEQKQN